MGHKGIQELGRGTAQAGVNGWPWTRKKPNLGLFKPVITKNHEKKHGTEVATTRPLTIDTLPSHGSQSYTRVGTGDGPGGCSWLARTRKKPNLGLFKPVMNEKSRKKRGTEVATTRPPTIDTPPSHGSQSYTKVGTGERPRQV